MLACSERRLGGRCDVYQGEEEYGYGDQGPSRLAWNAGPPQDPYRAIPDPGDHFVPAFGLNHVYLPAFRVGPDGHSCPATTLPVLYLPRTPYEPYLCDRGCLPRSTSLGALDVALGVAPCGATVAVPGVAIGVA